MDLPRYLTSKQSARRLFGTAIFIRLIERLIFVFDINSQYPEVYGNATFQGLVSGSFNTQIFYHVICIVLALNFIFGRFLLKTSAFSLFILITIFSEDSIYIGKGLLIFLPLLIFWSFEDSHYKKTIDKPTQLIFAIYLGCVYFFTAFHKTDPSWTKTGEALSLFYQTHQIATEFGANLILSLPTNFLKGITLVTLGFEYTTLPILIFLFLTRFKQRYLKYLFIIFFSFHITLFFTTILKSFSLAMISCWLVLLSSTDEKVQSTNHKGIAVTVYLLVCLFLWNLIPNTVKNTSWLRTVFIPQHWSLVAPSPGYYNYQFLVFNELNDIIFNSNQVIHDQNEAAFLTVIQNDDRLMSVFLRDFCRKNQKLRTELILVPKEKDGGRLKKRIKAVKEINCFEI